MYSCIFSGHRAHTVYIGVHLPGERRHSQRRRHHKHKDGKGGGSDKDDDGAPSKYEISPTVTVFISSLFLTHHEAKEKSTPLSGSPRDSPLLTYNIKSLLKQYNNKKIPTTMLFIRIYIKNFSSHYRSSAIHRP